MVLSNHVDFFRTQWTERFIDACTIDRVTARGALNQGTGQYDSPTSLQVYAGPCLVRPMSRAKNDQQYGQEQISKAAYEVMLPYDALGAQPRDKITITASAKEPALVGEVLDVFYEQTDSFNTHRVLVCEKDEGSGSP